jgi:hypothetical protein|eukprot:g1848.t1
MSLSKRERQAAEEARAQKLREEARATLKQKGITYDNAAAKRDFSNVRKKYDNTLELIKKRKLEKLSQNSKAAERAATNSGSAPSALVGHKKQRKVVKEAAQTKFGIPENSKAYSSRPPKDWVLVKQEHTGDYYFWNKRTNSTMRKMPSESLECVDQNLNNESDDEDENADGTIYSCFDEESKKVYYWNTGTWKASTDKNDTKVTEEELESSSSQACEETVDGVKYGADDWQRARKDAMSKRQKVE